MAQGFPGAGDKTSSMTKLVWNVTRTVLATCPVRFVHTFLQTWRRTQCGGCAIDGLRVLATVARYRR